MDAHIELDPQVASQLAALAAAKGVTVQQLLKEFVEQMSTLAPGVLRLSWMSSKPICASSRKGRRI